MRFLLDAQLPRRLAAWLSQQGHEAEHCSALADGNQTTDLELARHADRNNMVMVTKDADAVDRHLLRGCPKQLLLISLGNVTNAELQEAFRQHLPAAVEALTSHTFIEVGDEGVMVRG